MPDLFSDYEGKNLEDAANKLLQEAGAITAFTDDENDSKSKAKSRKPARQGKVKLLTDDEIERLPASDILLENKNLLELISKANADRKIDIADLSEAINRIALMPAHVEKIYKSLEALGIEMVDAVVPDDEDSEPPAEEMEEIEQEDFDESEEMGDNLPINDPVRLYLKDIGQYPLLTAEQEIELAKAIAAGLDAQKILDDEKAGNVTIPADEHDALASTAAAGNRAKERLTESNLRLVASIAKRYVGRGMLLLDLIQEGNIGLMKATVKFDHTKGYRFSTYATWWIRQAITRSINDQSRIIRIPVHMTDNVNKIIRASHQLMMRLGREPTEKEISEETGLSVNRVREIRRIAQDAISLETPIGDEEDGELGDFIPDLRSLDPADATAADSLSLQLQDILSYLPEREEKVLRMRFGMEDGRTRTLEEVGKEFNVTRERIRQIEMKALRRLRSPAFARRLKDYYIN